MISKLSDLKSSSDLAKKLERVSDYKTVPMITLTNLDRDTDRTDERLASHKDYKINSIFQKCGIEQQLLQRRDNSIELDEYNEEIEEEFESFNMFSQLSEIKMGQGLLDTSERSIPSLPSSPKSV
jgi:hypothetical protein